MKKLCAKSLCQSIGRVFSSIKLPGNRSRFSTNFFLITALALLIAFLAYPSGNPDLIEVSAQRNNLDLALKQMMSGKSIPAQRADPYEISPPIKKRLEALEKGDANPIASVNSGDVPHNAIASFPYVYPVMGPRKSSGYGLRVHPIRGFSTGHKGIDLAAPVGASIRAMAKGRVIFADPYAGYGNLVVIDHGNGVTTHYAHCDKLSVHTGENVETGQMIAEVGSTGMSTGPHLHLEVRIKGQPLNPEKYFAGLADKAEG